MKETVLIYIEDSSNYLIIHKNKKHDQNYDKYLGIGGHIEENEDQYEAVIREVKEESNLELDELKERGIVYFYNDDYAEKMFLFTSSKFHGSLNKECEEGMLVFINKDELINKNIWEGDKIFLQLLKENHPYFILNLYYKKDKFIDYKLL